VAQKLFFCLDHFHPDAGGRNAAPDDKSRYFAAEDKGCPECPTCERQVSAALVPDDKTLPASVVAALARAEHDLVSVIAPRPIPPPV
jgi:hypothetical protein